MLPNRKKLKAYLSDAKNRLGGEADTEDNKNHPFLMLEADTHKYSIGRQPCIDLNDLGHLSMTCGLFHTRFQPIANQTALQQLCRHVVWGKQNEAEMIIKAFTLANSELLHKSITVEDYAGRKVYGSPLQLALRLGDVAREKADECMAEMIERHLRTLSYSENLIQQQVAEVFGTDFESHLAQQIDNTYSLEALVIAINDATPEQVQAQLMHENNGSTLNQTFLLFREGFTMHSSQEDIFNPKHLQNAIEVYQDCYDDWSSEQCRLFWCQVVGYIQRFLPACYQQDWFQGLVVDIFNSSERKFQRKDTVCDSSTGKEISLLGFDKDPSYRLGFDFAIDANGEMRVDCGYDCMPVSSFDSLCEAKASSIQNFIDSQKETKMEISKYRGA